MPGPLEGAEVSARARAGETVHCQADLRVPAARISGTVRFEDGTPLAGAFLVASCLERGEQALCSFARSGGDGGYELEVVDIGQTFRIRASAHEETRERGNVAPGATGADFTFGRKHRVHVRLVEGATGGWLELERYAFLFARASDGGLLERVNSACGAPDADGWYELWLLDPRVDLLVLPLREFESSAIRILRGLDLRRPSGGACRAEFVLDRGLTAIIELDTTAGPLPEDHQLLLIEEELWGQVWPEYGGGWMEEIEGLTARRRLEFDGEHRAALAGLAPGRYRFKCSPADVSIDPDVITVDERYSGPMRVSWRPRH